MTLVLSDTDRNISEIIKNENMSIEELRKKFITRGLSGLINLGNTCYMNSALQCLSATDVLVSYFKGCSDGHGEFANDLKLNIKMTSKDLTPNKIREKFKNSLTYYLRNVLVALWSNNIKIKPKSFKEKIGNLKSMFNGYSQNDSQECLSFILDQMHEETKTDVILEIRNLPSEVIEFNNIREYYNKFIDNDNITIEEKIKYKQEFEIYKRTHLKEDAFIKSIIFWQKYLKKNHSAIIDIFTGLYFTEIKCGNCKNHSFNHDPFNLISLPIHDVPDGSTLEMCLKKNFNCTEELKDDNKYYCENCSGKYNSEKKTTIWHVPSRLIIQLKRFVNNGRFSTKINKNITFPITDLNMKDYFSDYSIICDQIYDLYGVIYHSGGLGGGHYVAYTKNLINNNWYLFDDENVLHIDDSRIKDKLNSSGAYVLFYKKREINLEDSL